MAKEAFYYPEEHTRLFADIISEGLNALGHRVPEEIAEQIQEHLDEMYAYADTFDVES